MRDWLLVLVIALCFGLVVGMVASTHWHQRKVGPITHFYIYIYSQGRWVEFVPKREQK